MHRRRRTLMLLALIPVSLTAGGLGYWWHASKESVPAAEDPIALLLGAPAMDEVALDPLNVTPTAPSYDDSHESIAAADEPIILATNASTPSSPSEYSAQQPDEEAFLAMAFEASAFGSDSGAGHANGGHGGGRSGGGGGGGGAGGGSGTGANDGAGAVSSGSDKASNHPSEHQPQSTSHRDPTADQAGSDPSGAIDDNEAADAPDLEFVSEQWAHTPPRDPASACYQLWCSHSHANDGTEGGSPQDQYTHDIPAPSSDVPNGAFNDETSASKPTVAVPEPGSLGLLTLGLLGVFASRQRRFRHS